jgi:hypothetical protein
LRVRDGGPLGELAGCGFELALWVLGLAVPAFDLALVFAVGWLGVGWSWVGVSGG